MRHHRDTYHRSIFRLVLLIFALLVFSGILYRVVSKRLGIADATPIQLPIPLSQFPSQIGLWVGRDVPIPLTVQQVARNDDFVSRVYNKSNDMHRVNFYLAYTARPRTMLGHRPQVCYPSAGWVLEGTEKISVPSLSGRTFPCLLHRFHRPAPRYESIVVLNFYVVNGEITNDDSAFTGLDWRTPNIEGNIAFYVAQVQISSTQVSSVQLAATEMADCILTYLPDRNGVVQAAGNPSGTESRLPQAKTRMD